MEVEESGISYLWMKYHEFEQWNERTFRINAYQLRNLNNQPGINSRYNNKRSVSILLKIIILTLVKIFPILDQKVFRFKLGLLFSVDFWYLM